MKPVEIIKDQALDSRFGWAHFDQTALYAYNSGIVAVGSAFSMSEFTYFYCDLDGLRGSPVNDRAGMSRNRTGGFHF